MHQVSSDFSMWRCGFSSAKLAHQKSKPVILLSQQKMFSIDSMRDRHELSKIIQCNSFNAYFCNADFYKSTTQLPLRWPC